MKFINKDIDKKLFEELDSMTCYGLKDKSEWESFRHNTLAEVKVFQTFLNFFRSREMFKGKIGFSLMLEFMFIASARSSLRWSYQRRRGVQIDATEMPDDNLIRIGDDTRFSQLVLLLWGRGAGSTYFNNHSTVN